MEVWIFGKKDCALCQTTKNKIEFFLSRKSLPLSIRFFDLDNLEDLAEASYHGVYKIPTTFIVKGREVLKKWEGKAPASEELERILEKKIGEN